MFEDQVMGTTQRWKKGEEPTLQEIVTMKLYTDFDKLQFAFKKCFRFESIDMDSDDPVIMEQILRIRDDLQRRIQTFFHWRQSLMVVLNKFGTRLRDNNIALFCGINAKMIFNPTQTFAFHGPLSTSSSHHVANTFATEKGMVIQMKSKYPRLTFCNAFDASLISDYPEEKEWLVGFMYVRILQISTKEVVNYERFERDSAKLSFASHVRRWFFAIHLFHQQVLSMSPHLERHIALLLRLNRKECCLHKEKYKEHHDDNAALLWYHHLVHDPHGDIPKDVQQAMQSAAFYDERMKKMAQVFWWKFHDFLETPNRRQCIKFDEVSKNLRPYFMEQSEEMDINTKEKKWIPSLDEIISVFPNVREIQFLNKYKFDDVFLQMLIKQIKRSHPENKLEKVVFLYFDYDETDGDGKPLDDTIFQDPDALDGELEQELENGLKWKISHGKNGRAGYKISVFKA